MDFLSGATMLAFAGSALFFWKFWRRTGEPFFALFSLGFTLFAASRVVHHYVHNDSDLAVYIVRLVAFATIMAAVLHKNLTDRRA